MKAEKAWTIYYFISEEENGGTVIRALTRDAETGKAGKWGFFWLVDEVPNAGGTSLAMNAGLQFSPPCRKRDRIVPYGRCVFTLNASTVH